MNERINIMEHKSNDVTAAVPHYDGSPDLVTFAVYSKTDHSLTFYRNKDKVCVGGLYNGKQVSKKYTKFEMNSPSSGFGPPWSSVAKDIKSVVVADPIKPKSTAFWFSDFDKCESFNLKLLDTSRVTDMRYMFYGAGGSTTTFELDLSGWDTSKVKTMRAMFAGAGRFAKSWAISGLDAWNTENIEDMSGMFKAAGIRANVFKLNLSDWNMSNVRDMSYMFAEAGFESKTWNIGDITRWNISKAVYLPGMFHNAGQCAESVPAYNLSHWHVSNVRMHKLFTSRGAKIVARTPKFP